MIQVVEAVVVATMPLTFNSICYMPNIALSAFCAFSELILTIIPSVKYYCFYLINEKTKDQRG